jgi:hypothetical protein
MVWLAGELQRVFASGKYVEAQREKMSRDEIRGDCLKYTRDCITAGNLFVFSRENIALNQFGFL